MVSSVVLNVISIVLVWVLLIVLVSIRRKNHAIANLLKEKSDQLQVSAEELRLLASTFNSHEPILITDQNLVVLRVNQAFLAATGYESHEVVGRKATDFSADDRNNPYEEIQRTLTSTGIFNGEVTARHKDGSNLPMHLRVSAIKDESQGTTHYVAVYSDISEQKRSQEEINKLAFYDPLTGLPNRRQIMERLDRELYLADRYDSGGALFFLDIDNFKDINDTLGHDHGDCLLIELGRRLRRHVRKTDMVSRLGGDEFLILLQRDTASEQDTIDHATSVCEKILSLSQEPYLIEGHKHYVSISIGITIFPSNAANPQDLLKQADTAMYKAKNAGKNTASFFHPEMQKLAEKKLVMERDLREALVRDEMDLQFQPQVDRDGQIRGVEALLRWTGPMGVSVSPNEFIPIAEQSGLIVQIGEYVLDQSCRQMKQWLESGLLLDHISVNVSPRQFADGGFLSSVQRTLLTTKLPAENLILELTESVVVENLEEARTKMEALNALGVRLSMDDFGTGYSSLSYLSELPFYELKIDQRFVRNLFNDRKNAVIATAIIAMAESLHLKVLAEGVENRDQLDFLRDHNCSMFQGYYFSKPLDAEDLQALLIRAPAERDPATRPQKGWVRVVGD
ncbi:MAG: EAL domain-containing protein [Gammaproteobacteria bacterium]|nr:EAL domain-containing protein [Gammaproteobacteria bacterium]